MNEDSTLGALPRPASRRWLRRLPAIIGLGILCVAGLILHRELAHISFHQVMSQMDALSLRSQLLAILLTAVSYASLTNYDRLSLKYINRSINFWKTCAISFTAFAVGHNVGVATISAGSIRLRAYTSEGLSALETGKIIVFCGLTFFLGGALLLGITLALEPESELRLLQLPTWMLHALAVVLIGCPLFYVGATLVFRRPISVGFWQVELPDFSIAIQQILFAGIDLIAAGGILYMLLPSSVDVAYTTLLGAYLIAIFMGIVSTVPAGLGVFEGFIILLLPTIPTAELLSAILAYRISYYLIPLFLSLLILVVRELSVYRMQVSSAVSHGRDWANRVAPQIIGITILIAGAMLIISGTLPGIKSRLHLLSQILPLSLLEFSSMANSAIGVGLLIVARGLYLRLRGAYNLAILLLLGGVLVSLGKGLDFEESIAMVLAVLLLWSFRKEFYRPATLFEQQFPIRWTLWIVGVLGASLWIGFFVYKHVEYRNALWWQFAFDANAPRMLRGTLVAMLVAASFALSRLTKSPPPRPQLPDRLQLAQAREIIERSNSAAANLALLGDKRLLFHPSDGAFVMYQVYGDSWIALGDPVGASDCYESLAWEFRELADRNGDRCAFYQVTEANLPLYVDMGLSVLKLGEEARVLLPDFTLTGHKRADLRHAYNRARRDGAEFEIIPAARVPAFMPELSQISNAWLAEKKSVEKGFSLGAFVPDYLCNFSCAVIRVRGQIVAFANIWESAFHNEVSVDLMRYNEAAPPGAMDYLFIELMLWGQAQGFKWFVLGMAPLSGLEMRPLSSLWNKVGNGIFHFGENFYNFEGLRRYKEKFGPEWQSVYLAAPGGLAFPRILFDATLLISGGSRRLISGGGRRFVSSIGGQDHRPTGKSVSADHRSR